MRILPLAIVMAVGGLCVGIGALEVGADPFAATLFAGAYLAAVWSIIYAVLTIGEKVGLE